MSRRRLSVRLAPGVWLSQDADQDVTKDPGSQILVALIVVALFLVIGVEISAFHRFKAWIDTLPSKMTDAVLMVGLGAFIAGPIMLVVEVIMAGVRRAFLRALLGLVIGAAIGILWRIVS